MSSDPKSDIAAALELDGAAAPLGVLRHAAAWAVRSLAAQADHDDTAAFECVVALDEALPRLGELLQFVPRLVSIAAPGGTVSARLLDQQQELSRLRIELGDERARLEQLTDLQHQVAQTQSERDRLRASIESLQRRKALADELPALRKLQAELEAATAECSTDDANDVAHRLQKATQVLLKLSEEQRRLLGTQLSQLLRDVVTEGRTLAQERVRRDELTDELTARRGAAEQLRQETQRSLPALEAHRQADLDLATALAAAGLPAGETSLESVRSSLNDIGQRLADLDGLLKRVLQQQEQTYTDARQVRNWLDSEGG